MEIIYSVFFIMCCVIIFLVIVLIVKDQYWKKLDARQMCLPGLGGPDCTSAVGSWIRRGVMTQPDTSVPWMAFGFNYWPDKKPHTIEYWIDYLTKNLQPDKVTPLIKGGADWFIWKPDGKGLNEGDCFVALNGQSLKYDGEDLNGSEVVFQNVGK